MTKRLVALLGLLGVAFLGHCDRTDEECRTPPDDGAGLCAEQWRAYPYHPPGTDIRFPEDEGAHFTEDLSVTMEWWYTIYHLETAEGRQFSIMTTFFMPQLDLAYRPFNITDVDSGEMFDTDEWGSDLLVVPGSLDLTWISRDPTLEPSTFRNQVDCAGEPIPFAYEQRIVHRDEEDPQRTQSLHLYLLAEKSPLIVGGDGYITIGDSGDSYYYTLSRMSVEGELEINGEVFEVTGYGWLDHQWGPFMLHPLAISLNSYEWMAIHLDNGEELMVSTLFDQQGRTYREEGFGSIGWKNADCTQGLTLNHTIERLAYWLHEETGNYYSHRWRITVPEKGLDLLVEPVIEDQTVRFYHTAFYEGRCRVTGTQHGVPVTGLAFAELVHHYDEPELQIDAPEDATTMAAGPVDVSWTVLNPDDGLPLTYDVTLSGDASSVMACEGVVALTCAADTAGLSGPVTVTVEACSVDRVICGQSSVDLEVVP